MTVSCKIAYKLKMHEYMGSGLSWRGKPLGLSYHTNLNFEDRLTHMFPL